ncbi:MAG: SUMF1/EgtB/PvdO family nonheme iron enzyme [Wenzhouxiangellaceae bacterium]|nr:SUMF1/EgtB/PvdO family nonheme iron enzyme [Wenzhouxiangellaceae bacterium]MBS3747376.1 SUMF1/EgtB/PvdO family nonheme iron enzyme [Wenzhouxiangellaceae bacterium]
MKLWLLRIVAGIFVCCALLPAVAQDEADDPSGAAEDSAEPERDVRRLGDVIGEGGSEFSMEIPRIEMPDEPVAEQPDVTLPDPGMDDRLQSLLARRASVADDPAIEGELASLLDEVEAGARQALAADDVELATRYADVLGQFDAQREVIAEVAAERERLQEVQRLLGLADQALEAGSLLEPPEASALALYRQSLALDEDSAEARAGLDAVRAQLFVRVDELLAQGNFEAARELLVEAEAMDMDPESIAERRAAVAEAREDLERRLIDDTRLAIDRGNFSRAETLINDLIGMGLEEDRIGDLRGSLDDAIRYGGFEPGQLFQDDLEGMDAYGPAMVVIPSGSFMMGSPEDEEGRVDNEGPRFRVVFGRGFALGQNEVTVGQFRRFVDATGYITDAERSGTSRIYMAGSGRVSERRNVTWEDDYLGEPAEDSLPVVHVSWNDASAYADWLAEQTDRAYRLPTEAEFEYALRAGSRTPYWWGDGAPDEEVENLTGEGDRFNAERRWTNAFRRYSDGYWGPAPVGSFVANPFGLFDMGGNVMEWVQDCWHDGYVRAPDDGSAWVNPGCDRRVIRGASWSSTPPMSRSAFRIASREDSTDARVGFRVARDL